MVTVLAFSTSQARGSAALLHAGRSHEVRWEDARGHAERALVAAQEVLDHAGIDRSAVEVLACDVGPGSFTGVRVAVATAKGIAIALDLPLVGVGSLESMSFAAFESGAIEADAIAVPLVDARRGEVFVAAYDATLAPVLAPAHVPRDAVAEALAPLVASGRALIGIGAYAPEALAVTSIRSLAGVACDHADAAWIARQAALRVAALDPEARRALDPALVEPVYVRPPDAKLPPPRAIG